MIKKITLKALQPLHLGTGNFGVVAETGIFIMPWHFVAGLGNKQNNFLDIDENFDDILEKVSVFVPKELENSLNNDEITRFRFKNINTYVSTAVNSINHGAIENSLHEIEYLNRNISFVGYVDLDENDNLIIGETQLELKQGLKFTIGGESRYGFGEIEIENIEDAEKNENLNLKKVGKNKLNLVFPVFLRVYDKDKGFGKKGVYKGFYGI